MAKEIKPTNVEEMNRLEVFVQRVCDKSGYVKLNIQYTDHNSYYVSVRRGNMAYGFEIPQGNVPYRMTYADAYDMQIARHNAWTWSDPIDPDIVKRVDDSRRDFNARLNLIVEQIQRTAS